MGRRVTGEEVMALRLHPTPPCMIPTSFFDFTSSLANWHHGFKKLVMKLLSSLLAVQLPSSVLLTGLPNGAGIGDQERDLAKALDPRCWVYRAKWEAGRKAEEGRQALVRGACPGPGWVNCYEGSRRFGSKGEEVTRSGLVLGSKTCS